MHIYKVLILGASYGSLLGAKLLLAGHDVTLVCRAGTAEAINRKGIRIQLPVSWKEEFLEVDSLELRGKLSASAPEAINSLQYDLVVLAMQEPHYSLPGVRELLDAVAREHVPCMSIMNMPPPPYLKRIPGLDVEPLESCYKDASVWQNFDPAYMTLCSPDPQTFRLSDDELSVLRVTLPTNFKAARFESDEHTSILRQLQAHVAVGRYHEMLELPVKLKVFDSIFVPLAKWPMLITGNYRCIERESARSIREAVLGDVEVSRSIYEWVCDLCIELGASRSDLVPFEKYAAAASSLDNPSSAASALFDGATDIERVDRLVQAIALQKGKQSTVVDETVRLIDLRLAANRKKAAERALLSA